MSDNLVPYSRSGKAGRGIKKAEPIECGDLAPVLDLVITAARSRNGRGTQYPNTKQGLDAFVENTLSFFEYCEEINANPDITEKQKLVPDIELWGTYIGVTRKTILMYEKRGGEWQASIEYFKNSIAAIKKNLAIHGKIPPLITIFDFTNNHNYVNASEFKLTNVDRDQVRGSVDDQAMDSNLVWNAEKQRYEPMEG